MSPSERRAMIRKDTTDLSFTRQCKLLKINRSSIHYTPVGFDQAKIELMHEIDQIFTKYAFFGSRQIVAYLPQPGFAAGRHRARFLVAIMDWAKRKVLSSRLSNTLDPSVCVEALEEAIAKYG
jgi:putative transposase